jgi:hypothetical protein
MMIAVRAASHPEIDGVDKALLMALAMDADYKTGKNSRPGNASLQSGTVLEYSALRDRIKKNLRLGLMECTYEAHGRGKASVYRLCLECPAYPDRSTSGEWLLDGLENLRPTPEVLAAESAENLRPIPEVSSADTCGQNAETSGAISQKPPAEASKTSGSSRSTPSIPSAFPPTNLPSQKDGGLEGWILKNYATMGEPNEATQIWLQKQSAEHGEAVIVETLDRFLLRPGGFVGVKNPWALFNSESARLIVIALQDAKAADEKARLSAATDAYVRQQQDAHAKFMEYEPPRPSEVDPSEYMDE